MKINLINITAAALLASGSAAFAQTDFAKYDQNRDNIITVDEYLDATLAPFDRLDADANGWLSQAELMPIARQRAEGTQRKPRLMVNRIFERFDSNEDRRLTALELGFGGSGEFFNLYDRNFDGSITLAEWRTRTPAPTQTTAEAADSEAEGSENGSSDTTESTPQETSGNGRPIVPRTPTEPSEQGNSNAWKTDGIPDITSTQTMTGSWVFDLRP